MKYPPEKYINIYSPEIEENLVNNNVNVDIKSFIDNLLEIIINLKPNRRFENRTKRIIDEFLIKKSNKVYYIHWIIKALKDDDSYVYAYNYLAQKINRESQDSIYPIKNPNIDIDGILHNELLL